MPETVKVATLEGLTCTETVPVEVLPSPHVTVLEVTVGL
jgi:hypothetical protein